jgi:hypothetical protein
MMLGLNTNVTCNGVGYHVQTEDLGRANPYVLTLVFRGGAIVAREKVNYLELLGDRPRDAQVKALMERQHARISKQVIAGELPAPEAAPEPVPRSTPPGSSPLQLGLPPVDRQLDDIIAEYLRQRRRS